MQLLVRNRVADYDTWMDVVRRDEEARQAAGLELLHLWRCVDEPNQIFFVLGVADRSAAEAFKEWSRKNGNKVERYLGLRIKDNTHSEKPLMIIKSFVERSGLKLAVVDMVWSKTRNKQSVYGISEPHLEWLETYHGLRNPQKPEKALEIENLAELVLSA